MATCKTLKRQTMIYKTLHKKLRLSNMNPTKTKVSSCAPVERFCSTGRFTLVENPMKNQERGNADRIRTTTNGAYPVCKHSCSTSHPSCYLKRQSYAEQIEKIK